MQTVVNTKDLDFDKVWLMFQETNKVVNETSRAVRNLMKQTRESESRWGRFVEALVEGSLVRILNDFGITVNRTLMREKTILENDDYEIDIIAKNGHEIVAIEVKTTLDTSDVQNFMKKLEKFKKAFPDYESNSLYGGIAYIQKNSEADKYAAKNGLIVIKAVGESTKITNRKDFKPRIW